MAEAPTDPQAARARAAAGPDVKSPPKTEGHNFGRDVRAEAEADAESKGQGKKDRWTLLEVLRWTTGRFAERGLETPRLDAELLIAAALSLPRVQLYVQFDRPLAAPELAAIRELVRRRQAGESVAYVVGHKEFFGLDFLVDRRVLVPRPDTETLVDEVLARVREKNPPAPSAEDALANSHSGGADAGADADAAVDPVAAPAPIPSRSLPTPRIVDVGTGSGAIAITVAKQLPGATVIAVDISTDALEVARANAAHHAVTVAYFAGDLTAPLAGEPAFDVIAANLPYIPTGDLAALSPEVRSEPHAALDGGADGLALVRRLVAAAPALLVSGGALVLEIGAGQAEQTVALCRQAGFVDVRVRRDLGAIDRIVSALKP